MQNINEKQAVVQGWLGHTPEIFSNKLLAQSTRVEVEKGRVIFSVGEEANGLWGIAKGQAHFNIATHESGPRFAHIIGPGSWFGDHELLTGSTRILEVKTSSDCVLFHVPERKFLSLAAEYQLTWRWLGLLTTQHTFLALGSADDLMIGNSEVRLAALLLRLSGRRGAPEKTIPLDELDVTQQNISDVLNLSRTATGQKLRRFRNENIIGFSYNKLQILDPQALAARLID